MNTQRIIEVSDKDCKVEGVNTDDIIDRKLAKLVAKFDLSLI